MPLTEIPDWSGKTILIAEDLDNNYTVLAALLKKTQVQLLRAHNGAEAILMVAQQKHIDLILMDISMPGLDGIEALRKIRQQSPDKTVIAQTAHDFSLQLSGENFDGYIQKPIRRRKLLELLSKYLS